MQQSRISGLAQVVKVLKRFLHTQTKGSLPKTIGNGGGKAGIFLMGQPLGETGPKVFRILVIDRISRSLFITRLPNEKQRFDAATRFDVIVGIIIGKPKSLMGLGANPRQIGGHGLNDVLLRKLLIAKLIADFSRVSVTDVRRSEKGGKFEVFPLSPIRKRMIVALSASHVCPQENGQGIGQIIQGHTRIPQQISGGTGLGDAPLRRKHIEDHLVPRTVEGNLILQPPFVMVVARSPDVLLVTEQIRQPIEEVRTVSIRKKQTINQFPAFFGILVRKEIGGLVISGNPTCGIEINPSQKNKIISGWIRLQPCLFQAFSDKTVNPQGRRTDLLFAHPEFDLWLTLRRVADLGKRGD